MNVKAVSKTQNAKLLLF